MPRDAPAWAVALLDGLQAAAAEFRESADDYRRMSRALREQGRRVREVSAQTRAIGDGLATLVDERMQYIRDGAEHGTDLGYLDGLSIDGTLPLRRARARLTRARARARASAQSARPKGE